MFQSTKKSLPSKNGQVEHCVNQIEVSILGTAFYRRLGRRVKGIEIEEFQSRLHARSATDEEAAFALLGDVSIHTPARARLANLQRSL